MVSTYYNEKSEETMLALNIFLTISSIPYVVSYDASKEITKRTLNVKSVCDKYRNNPKFEALYQTVPDPSKNYVQNWASKFFICVPAENGAVMWNRFFRQVHNFDLKVYLTIHLA